MRRVACLPLAPRQLPSRWEEAKAAKAVKVAASAVDGGRRMRRAAAFRRKAPPAAARTGRSRQRGWFATLAAHPRRLRCKPRQNARGVYRRVPPSAELGVRGSSSVRAPWRRRRPSDARAHRRAGRASACAPDSLKSWPWKGRAAESDAQWQARCEQRAAAAPRRAPRAERYIARTAS